MSDINITVNDEIVNIDIVDEPVLVNVINSPGVPGAPGVGVPVGGTTGQVLAKNSATNYDTEWVDVSGGAWGTITGTLSNQTDLQSALDGKFDDPTGTTAQYLRGDGSLATFPSLTGYVPYTGATGDVNLGTHRILAQNATIASSGSGDTVEITHSSGSGIGLNITKGGNGEGLYINKTGGSGNAATIIGTINATTLVKSGGTSSQFLKADGTVDSSVYVPTSTTLTINGVSYDLSANRSWTVAGGISGSGASGQVAYWTGTSAQSGSNNLFWDNANGRLGIGTTTPATIVDVNGGTNAVLTARFLHQVDYPTLIIGRTTTRYAQLTWDNPLGEGLFQTFNRAFPFTFDASAIKFMTTGVVRARIFETTGNVLLQNGGTFTDGGQRLQVQGTTLLNGNVTFSSSTGMFWDATNSRLGIGTNAPATILDIKGNRAVVSITDNFTSNRSTTFFGAYDDVLQLSVNRNPSSGIFSQTTKASSQISLVGAAGLGTISFYTTNANNTIPNEVVRILGTGNVLIQNAGTFTDSGERLQVTGTMKVTGVSSFGDSLTISKNSNAILGLVISNTTAGTVSSPYLQLVSDATAGSAQLFKYSSTRTPYKTIAASDFGHYNATAGDISFLNDFASGAIKFAAGGSSTAYMTIKSNGRINMSSLPTSPTGLSSGDLWNNLGMINIV